MKPQLAVMLALALGASAAPHTMKATKKQGRAARTEGKVRVVKHLKNLLVSAPTRLVP